MKIRRVTFFPYFCKLCGTWFIFYFLLPSFGEILKATPELLSHRSRFLRQLRLVMVHWKTVKARWILSACTRASFPTLQPHFPWFWLLSQQYSSTLIISKYLKWYATSSAEKSGKMCSGQYCCLFQFRAASCWQASRCSASKYLHWFPALAQQCCCSDDGAEMVSLHSTTAC